MPLSAVTMMQSLSDFSHFKAFYSSLVKLALEGLDCLRILEISVMRSSTSLGFKLWHATSMTVIYSLLGCLGLLQS